MKFIIARCPARRSETNLMQLRTLNENKNTWIGNILLQKHCMGSDSPNPIFRKSELNCSRVSMAGALVAWQKLYHGNDGRIYNSGWPQAKIFWSQIRFVFLENFSWSLWKASLHDIFFNPNYHGGGHNYPHLSENCGSSGTEDWVDLRPETIVVPPNKTELSICFGLVVWALWSLKTPFSQ